MNLSNDALFYTIVGIAVLAAARLYYVIYKDAKEINKKEPKQPHQVRRVTDFSKGTIGIDPIEKPKRKRKKYYNNKKPAIANNETIAKKPVGRPRKTVE